MEPKDAGETNEGVVGAAVISGVMIIMGLLLGPLLTWWIGTPLIALGALALLGLAMPDAEPSAAPSSPDPKWTPPPGVSVPAGGRFMRLTQHRGRGLSEMGQLTEVICGRCGWAYTLPSWVIKNYRNETTWGASARRLGQPEVAMNQRQATEAMRCPQCGSIDPGVWVKA